ncbi:hypothetical protein B0H15DRAFT_956025 [Mycena belliarum]|uniref:Uncharacterized protein n=1 Tax=Mycena belliarum TaxID=1033014 RepID=A0AAD6XJX8_9AGAR|nr:hypothetical protein B0H15DRAFT_956025 [Mycena belliae]
MAGQTIPRNRVTACRLWPAFGLPRLLDMLARVVDAQGCFTQAGYEVESPSGTSAITPRDAPSHPPPPFLPFRERDGIRLHVDPFILTPHGLTSPRYGALSPLRASLLSRERLHLALLSGVPELRHAARRDSACILPSAVVLYAYDARPGRADRRTTVREIVPFSVESRTSRGAARILKLWAVAGAAERSPLRQSGRHAARSRRFSHAVNSVATTATTLEASKPLLPATMRPQRHHAVDPQDPNPRALDCAASPCNRRCCGGVELADPSSSFRLRSCLLQVCDLSWILRCPAPTLARSPATWRAAEAGHRRDKEGCYVAAMALLAATFGAVTPPLRRECSGRVEFSLWRLLAACSRRRLAALVPTPVVLLRHPAARRRGNRDPSVHPTMLRSQSSLTGFLAASSARTPPRRPRALQSPGFIHAVSPPSPPRQSSYGTLRLADVATAIQACCCKCVELAVNLSWSLRLRSSSPLETPRSDVHPWTRPYAPRAALVRLWSLGTSASNVGQQSRVLPTEIPCRAMHVFPRLLKLVHGWLSLMLLAAFSIVAPCRCPTVPAQAHAPCGSLPAANLGIHLADLALVRAHVAPYARPCPAALALFAPRPADAPSSPFSPNVIDDSSR